MCDFFDFMVLIVFWCLWEVGYVIVYFGKWYMGGGWDVGDVLFFVEYGFDRLLVLFEGLGDWVLLFGNLFK